VGDFICIAIPAEIPGLLCNAGRIGVVVDIEEGARHAVCRAPLHRASEWSGWAAGMSRPTWEPMPRCALARAEVCVG
jgi:hypothetical protein